MMDRFRRRRRGQALVEFGLVLPILVLVMVAILEFGFLVKDFLSVNYLCSQAVKEAARMRGDTQGDLRLAQYILERTYGLFPDRLRIVSGSGTSHGPLYLDGTGAVIDGDGADVTGFSEPLFFFSDNGTPGNTSDDTGMGSTFDASYVTVTLSYTHENLAPYPEFMKMDGLVITATRTAAMQ